MIGPQKFRPGVVSALALLLLAPGFAGCKKKPAEGAAPATEAASAAPAPKVAGGAETPAALVARMKQAAADKNMPEVVACLSPKARQEMSQAMYLGATMMVAFSQMGAEMGGAMMEGASAMVEGMGGEVSAEDKKKAEEGATKAKADLAKLGESYNALMKKYGLPAMPKEGEPEPPEPSKEEIDKLFANLDHGAFIADVIAVLESMPGDKGAAKDTPIDIKEGELENLKVEGDKATGSVGGEPLNFVQIDGRWYLDIDPMGGGMETAEPSDVGEGEAKERPGI